MKVDSQYSGPLDKNHFDFLHCVYKAYELNRTTKNISLGYIANYLGFSRGEIIVISKYLSTQDFIQKDNPLDEIDCHVSITAKGIAELNKQVPQNLSDSSERLLRSNINVENVDIAVTKQVAQTLTVSPHPPFINEGRLQELRNFSSKHSKFDYSKLIRLCEELNSNYSKENYYATAMLTRAIMDHVPPIFGKNNFSEVANNYSGGDSFKKR